MCPSHPPARVEIFDVAGRRVRRLVDTALPAGDHTAHWDGRDGAGRGIAPGIYLVRLTAGIGPGAMTESEKFTVLR